MNSSEKNYHFKQLIQLKVGVGPESDNRNCPESESDDGTSDSTALIPTEAQTQNNMDAAPVQALASARLRSCQSSRPPRRSDHQSDARS